MDGLRRGGQGVLLLVLCVAGLQYAHSAPVAGDGTQSVHPVLFIGVVVAGLVWIVGILLRRVNFWGVVLAFAVGAALIWLNGTGHMPLVDNPCPHLEVGVYVNGECHGMDVDANRAWVEGQVQR